MDTFRLLPAKGFDYINSGNPTASVNPPVALVTWLNASNGNLFICTDNTVDANVWVPQAIVPITEYTPTVSNWASSSWDGKYGRLGRCMYLEIFGTITGDPTGIVEIDVPEGLSLPSFYTTCVGYVMFIDTSPSAVYYGFLKRGSAAGKLAVMVHNAGSTYLKETAVNSGVPFSWATTDYFRFFGLVPINEWT